MIFQDQKCVQRKLKSSGMEKDSSNDSNTFGYNRDNNYSEK